MEEGLRSVFGDWELFPMQRKGLGDSGSGSRGYHDEGKMGFSEGNLLNILHISDGRMSQVRELKGHVFRQKGRTGHEILKCRDLLRTWEGRNKEQNI